MHQKDVRTHQCKQRFFLHILGDLIVDLGKQILFPWVSPFVNRFVDKSSSPRGTYKLWTPPSRNGAQGFVMKCNQFPSPSQNTEILHIMQTAPYYRWPQILHVRACLGNMPRVCRIEMSQYLCWQLNTGKNSLGHWCLFWPNLKQKINKYDQFCWLPWIVSLHFTIHLLSFIESKSLGVLNNVISTLKSVRTASQLCPFFMS